MRYMVTSISEGIAIGHVLIYHPCDSAGDSSRIAEQNIDDELLRYERILKRADEELGALSETVALSDENTAKIFKAQREMLNDHVVLREVRARISKNLATSQSAIQDIYDKYIAVLAKSKNELISQRATDLADVKRRLLRICLGNNDANLSDLPNKSIIVARELLPSDTMALDHEHVCAIVTQEGGATSHAGIIARGLGIPAVVWPDALSHLQNGDTVIVDAQENALIREPQGYEQSRYCIKRNEWLENRAEILKYLKAEPVTKDDRHIGIHANIGSAGSAELAVLEYTEGVGLFRTEFVFIEKNALPDENEQFRIYRRVLEKAKGKPVTLRTLDIGGDKELRCLTMPKEKNPALGVRAIRLCFERPELLQAQLRAAYRASAFGKLEIMFPMVSSVEDIRRCQNFAKQARDSLRSEGVSFDESVALGIMVEIPAIALMAQDVAQLVDFASIGTNDLCQYLAACDRMDARLEAYYQSCRPALFRCVKSVVDAFAARNKTVSVCGELAGEPAAAFVFMGLGVKKLSMGMEAVPQVKRMISNTTMQKAEQAAREILGMQSAADIQKYLMSTDI